MSGALKSIAALVMGSGAQLASNALAGFLATAWLPVSQRGLMILILSLTAILGLIVSAGLGNTLRAQVPRLVGADALAIKDAYATAAGTVLLIGVAMCVGASIALQAIDVRMASIPVIAVVVLATIAQVATVLLTDARFAGGHFTAASRWAALSAFAGVAGLVGVKHVCAVAGVETSAVTLIAVQYGAIALVLAASVPSAIRSGDVRFKRWRGRGARTLLRAGIATMALPLAIVLITRSDRLMLGAATTASTVAVYGLAATYCEVLRIVPTAIAQLSTARVASGGDISSVSRLAILSVASTTVLGALLFAVVSFATVPLFGDEYANAVSLTLLMLPGEIFYALIVLGNLILIGGQWSRVSTIIGVSTTPLSLLIYGWGAHIGAGEGLAIARNLAFLLMAGAVVVAACICLAKVRSSVHVNVLAPELPRRPNAGE